jgi:hypothetical protein
LTQVVVAGWLLPVCLREVEASAIVSTEAGGWLMVEVGDAAHAVGGTLLLWPA